MDAVQENLGLIDLGDIPGSIRRLLAFIGGRPSPLCELRGEQQAAFNWRSRRGYLLRGVSSERERAGALLAANEELNALGDKRGRLGGLGEADLVRRAALSDLVEALRGAQHCYSTAVIELAHLGPANLLARHQSLVQLVGALKKLLEGETAHGRPVRKPVRPDGSREAPLDPATTRDLQSFLATTKAALVAVEKALFTWPAEALEEHATALVSEPIQTVQAIESVAEAPAAA
jgi:hypothetical protein